MKIAIACDHGALELKLAVKEHLLEKGFEVCDFGTDSLASCDYPDFGEAAARAVSEGKCDKGIVMCTTGIGVSVVANKIDGVRCALLHDLMTAKLTREHNDTNVMAMGAGIVGELLALQIVDTWLTTPFSQGERHARRIAKVNALDGE